MRIRSIKPEFWRSDDVNSMCIEDRLLFIGLWSYVDDNGVGIDRHSDICADLFAHDLSVSPHDTLMRVHDGLNRLQTLGVIRRYEVGGKRFMEITNWASHQKINRPSPGRYPKSDTSQAVIHDVLSEGSVRAHVPEQGNRGTEEQGNSGARQAGSTKRPRRPIPDDWAPTDKHITYADDRDIDVDREAETYRAHAEANDRRLVDWDAGFRQWLTNAKPRSTGRPSERDSPRTFGQMKHDNNLALWAQVQAEEEGNEEWPRQLGA